MADAIRLRHGAAIAPDGLPAAADCRSLGSIANCLTGLPNSQRFDGRSRQGTPVGRRGLVTHGRWDDGGVFLRRCGAIFLSREDVSGDDRISRSWRPRPLARGNRWLPRRQCSARPFLRFHLVMKEVDPTRSGRRFRHVLPDSLRREYVIVPGRPLPYIIASMSVERRAWMRSPYELKSNSGSRPSPAEA
jgi:hypothetical protein